MESNAKLVDWCRAVRDARVTERTMTDIQDYLDKSPTFPRLVYRPNGGRPLKIEDVYVDYRLRTGNPNLKNFDADEAMEPGLVTINDFVRYLSDYGKQRRRRIADCAQCGDWFEWSGHGFANKYCTRRCRNKANYAKRRQR